jgi:hypothetical protein
MFTILYRRKQAKMQWLQDPNQSNIDNPNNSMRESSRHVRKKRNNTGELKIDEIEISKISEICIRLSMILRRVNGLKLI